MRLVPCPACISTTPPTLSRHSAGGCFQTYHANAAASSRKSSTTMNVLLKRGPVWLPGSPPHCLRYCNPPRPAVNCVPRGPTPNRSPFTPPLNPTPPLERFNRMPGAILKLLRNDHPMASLLHP